MKTLTAAQQTIAKAMMEATLEQNVADACRALRLRRYHTHRSQHSVAGFPDDVILGPTRMIFRELKRESFDPSPAQREWLDHLAAIGQDVGVWRPSDWLSGRIMAELQALSARH